MGLWYDEFDEGKVIRHSGSVKITQEDNAAFCNLTKNTQPLHFDKAAAEEAGFKGILVNGLYTFSAAVGVSVPELTEGTLIANLGYADIKHPSPVYPGDVLHVTSQVLHKRKSSKPGRGIVTIESRVVNQDDVEVCTFQRSALVRAKDDEE